MAAIIGRTVNDNFYATSQAYRRVSPAPIHTGRALRNRLMARALQPIGTELMVSELGSAAGGAITGGIIMNTRTDRNIRLRVRRLIIVLSCITLMGCQSFQSIGGAPPGLHEEIRSGRLVKVGERVRVTTQDGRSHEFTVRSIDHTTLAGTKQSITIEEIRSVDRAHFSAGRTALLVGGILAVMAGLLSSADTGPTGF